MSTRPNKLSRRFDSFAEYRKQDEQASGCGRKCMPSVANDRLTSCSITRSSNAWARSFTATLFEPAVRAAREQGQSYEAIRERLRGRWKPAAIDQGGATVGLPGAGERRRHPAALAAPSGPYMLDCDRQFGSTRFMAPEEFERGASEARGSRALYDVARTATELDPDKRFASVSEFLMAWRTA
jgi:hypothetical protein